MLILQHPFRVPLYTDPENVALKLHRFDHVFAPCCNFKFRRKVFRIQSLVMKGVQLDFSGSENGSKPAAGFDDTVVILSFSLFTVARRFFAQITSSSKSLDAISKSCQH